MSMAKFYFSYGDFGNLVGRMTKYWGIRFGHFGLFISLETQTVKEYSGIEIDPQEQIVLATDPEAICEYLGLNWAEWLGGYKSEEQIFKWIKSSHLYLDQIYAHANHTHRHKINTRPMYERFVKSINLDGLDNLTQVQMSFQSKQLDAIVYFGKTNELMQIVTKSIAKKARKEKFNGNKLMDMGVPKEKVGKFIIGFKEFVQEENFDIWLDGTSQELIDKLINEYIVLF